MLRVSGGAASKACDLGEEDYWVHPHVNNLLVRFSLSFFKINFYQVNDLFANLVASQIL